MRISEFSVQIKSEVSMVFDFFVSQSDRFSFLDQDSAQQGIQDWFNLLIKVLNQQSVAFANRTEKKISWAKGTFTR